MALAARSERFSLDPCRGGRVDTERAVRLGQAPLKVATATDRPSRAILSKGSFRRDPSKGILPRDPQNETTDPVGPVVSLVAALSLERDLTQAISVVGNLVRRRGLEPLRCYPLAPQASASANSATFAQEARTLLRALFLSRLSRNRRRESARLTSVCGGQRSHFDEELRVRSGIADDEVDHTVSGTEGRNEVASHRNAIDLFLVVVGEDDLQLGAG